MMNSNPTTDKDLKGKLTTVNTKEKSLNDRRSSLLSYRLHISCELLSNGITGDFFKEWKEITPQTHIRKFKE